MAPSVRDPQTERELLIVMNEKLDRLINNDKDHEERIRCIEGSFWKTVSLASTIAFFAGIFGGKMGGMS